jgi:hypothetical protein
MFIAPTSSQAKTISEQAHLKDKINNEDICMPVTSAYFAGSISATI